MCVCVCLSFYALYPSICHPSINPFAYSLSLSIDSFIHPSIHQILAKLPKDSKHYGRHWAHRERTYNQHLSSWSFTVDRQEGDNWG